MATRAPDHDEDSMVSLTLLPNKEVNETGMETISG